MKKTLTIMMTAAAALLGLGSCSNSDGDNYSSSSAAPISAENFASGDQYYSVNSQNGGGFTLSAAGNVQDDGSATVTLTMTLNGENVETFTASGVTYMVDGTRAHLINITGWNGTMTGNFCEIWGLKLKANETTYNLGSGTQYEIRIENGMATMSVPVLDSNATVEKDKSSVTYTQVRTVTKQATNTGAAQTGN